MNHRNLLLTYVLIFTMLASCASPTPQILPTTTQSPEPTESPTETSVPTATSIPGFEGWSVFNPGAVQIVAGENSLTLTLTRRALWFMQERGVLIHRPVSGNFMITAEIRTEKASDPSRPPGGDGSVQLSGLMARDGSGGLENYVFIVVGDDGNGLSVETKNTVDGFSEYDGPSWGSDDAELRICRFGSIFNLYKRVIGSGDPWEMAASFDRPDLPDELQVGVNIYTDSTPDLQARIENLQIESVSSQDVCES